MGDAVTQDNIDCEINKGNSTYGNRTNDRFRAHYTTRFGHPPAGDPTFSIVHHLRKLRARGLSGDALLTEPVVHEYIRFGYKLHLAAWADVAATSRRKTHNYSWFLGCILPSVPAIIVAGIWAAFFQERQR